MRKFLTLLLALAMFSPVAGAACQYTMHPITVSPATSGAIACYEIVFDTTCPIVSGSVISFVFPNGTGLEYVTGSQVYFDRRADRIEVEGQTVKLQLTSDLPVGSHKLRICNVINPPNVGPHVILLVTNDGVFATPQFVFKDTGVSPANIVAQPDIVKECVSIEITFTVTSESGTGCHCSRETIFYIDFPLDFEMPASVDPQYISVEGVAVEYARIDGHTLIIKSRLHFDAGQSVTIKIDSKAGLKNPKTPGWYRLIVYTSADRIPTPSNSYYIRSSSITRPNVTVDRAFTCTQTGFVIKFETGLRGEIPANGSLKVIFPEGFTVPDSIEPGNVAINEAQIKTKLSTYHENIGYGSSLTIPVINAINSETSVTVVILGGAGIKLPSTYGNQTISIETSAEPVRVPSFPFVVNKSRLENVTYESSPSFVTLNASQVISFKTGGCGALIPGIDTITIGFPDSMVMPKSLTGVQITVNDKKLDKIAFLSGSTLTVSPPEKIDGDSWVTIIIPKECGIRNPTKAGAGYKVRVWTTVEPSPVSSNVVVFASTRLSGVKGELSKYLALSRVQVKLQFISGQAGALRNGSKVEIKIPDGFEFRGSVSANNFAFDGLSSRTVSWVKPVLTLTCPRDYEPNSVVTIAFSEECGLTTPEKSGFYNFSVATESEPEMVESDDIPVNGKPVLQIDSPVANANGWHTAEPDIEMKASSELDSSPAIKMIVDNIETDYKGKFKVHDGFHVIEAWSVDKFGNKSEKQSLSFSVDTIAPSFEISDEALWTSGKTFFKMFRASDENKFTLSFTGDPGVSMAEQIPGFVSVSGASKTETCQNVVLTATDEAGNKTDYAFKICYDWTPPNLDIPSRLEATDPVIVIKGVTEPESSLKVGEVLAVGADGSFEVNLKLKNGFNSFSFEAKDRAGNITRKSMAVMANLEVILVLENGKKDAYLNGSKVMLKTAPFVYKGCLYAPFSLIVKACAFKLETWPYSAYTLTDLNGKASFIHPKKSIEMAAGNDTTVVDGDLVKLPSAPIVKNGELYVPIRFTAGLFGLSLQTEGKAIKISFLKN